MLVEYYRGNNYPEYFLTPHWKALKQKLIYENPTAKCWICGSTSTLLLHHVFYGNLFNEKLGRDVFILCFTCHTRTHFTTWGYKIPLEEGKLLARMKFLRITYPIRSFRLGSCINKIGLAVMS